MLRNTVSKPPYDTSSGHTGQVVEKRRERWQNKARKDEAG
jgi:hypothetical protein